MRWMSSEGGRCEQLVRVLRICRQVIHTRPYAPAPPTAIDAEGETSTESETEPEEFIGPIHIADVSVFEVPGFAHPYAANAYAAHH